MFLNLLLTFIAILSLLVSAVDLAHAQPPTPATGILVLVYGIH